MTVFSPLKVWLSGVAVSGLLVASSANASEQRQMDAHEHGVTVVNAALEGKTLVIELESPAMNIVGFEHPARSEEDKQAVANALKVLKTDGSMFVTNPEAQCSISDVKVEHIVEAADDDHDDS